MRFGIEIEVIIKLINPKHVSRLSNPILQQYSGTLFLMFSVGDKIFVAINYR